MAEVVHDLHVSLQSAREGQGGVVGELVTRYRITGITDTDLGALKTALDASGVPSYGDAYGADFPNLVVTGREVSIVDADAGTYDVDITYGHFTEDQDQDDPLTGVLQGELQASIQQVTSNVDANGDTITVEHTYPSDDPDFPDETKVQGGEITYFEVQKTIRMRGFRTIARPWLIVSQIQNKLNKNPWNGGAARTWLCTNATSTILNRAGDGTYEMTFEFQYNPDGWDPTVVFIDERTGKPAVGLVEGTGYKQIQRLDEINFDAVLLRRSFSA